MKKGKICFLLMIVLSFLWVVNPGVGAELNASAALNTDSFPLDSGARLTITVDGVNSFQPQIPEIKGLRFHHRGQSSQVQIINGDYSASVTSTYFINAEKTGSYTIPPITVISGKGETVTDEIKFTVTEPQSTVAAAPAQGGGSATRLRSGEAEEVAFMRVVPAGKVSYSGELVPVQIKVYFREGIKADLTSLPQLAGDGFVLQQLDREPQQTREWVNQTPYSVLTWNSTLTGIKEGEHMLGMELDATLLLREQRSRMRPPGGMFGDPFFDDSFFDSFFGTYRQKEVKIVSPEIEIKVEPLPAQGKPDNFSGAIGDFNLQVEAGPLQISKGDPVTLTVTVSGQGNFDRVQIPRMQTEDGWKTYSPSSEFIGNGSAGRGKKVFEQAIVAKSAGVKEISPLFFDYFDPASKSYRRLVSEPIQLTVKDNDPGADRPAAMSQEPEPVQNDDMALPPEVKQEPMPVPGLAPLRLSPGSTASETKPLFMRRWFQIFAGLLLLGLVLGLAVRLRYMKLAANPHLQKRKAMDSLWRAGESEIKKYLENGDSRGFLAACISVVREQLGLLWDREGSAITLADLRAKLAPDSILVEIFQEAESSVYGGSQLSDSRMREFADGLKRELDSLS